MNYTDDRDRELRETFDSARLAIECDDKDPLAHWVLARAYLINREYDRAIAEFETAIKLNPSFAHGYYMLGWTFMLTGQYVVSLQNLEYAMRLNPHDPLSFAMMMCSSTDNAFLGEMDIAVEWAERGVRQPNAHKHIYANAALIGALAEREDVLKTGMDYLSQHNPDYSCADFLRTFPYKNKSDYDFILNGLRKAGLPEE